MSPGLDYTQVLPSTGAFAVPLGAASFYDGREGRTLVTCPDCSRPADESLGGDHGGACIESVLTATPTSALGIIRSHAKRRAQFSMNDLREAMIAAGTTKGSRNAALRSAQKRGWIEQVGFVESTDARTKRHHIATYRSLIFQAKPRKVDPR